MYFNQAKQGFTLIELLVVVLIIGILAAIALPQYQKAVEKSKSAQAMALLNPLIQSIEAYHLANGTYPTKFEQLDVEVPNWTGTEKPYQTLSNYRTGEEWSAWLFNHASSGVGVMITHMSGPYKGGGFGYHFYRVKDDGVPVGKISCVELYNFNLAAGAYCEKIFKGVFYGDADTDVRWYLLP